MIDNLVPAYRFLLEQVKSYWGLAVARKIQRESTRWRCIIKQANSLMRLLR
jgi:hypothetical protein